MYFYRARIEQLAQPKKNHKVRIHRHVLSNCVEPQPVDRNVFLVAYNATQQEDMS